MEKPLTWMMRPDGKPLDLRAYEEKGGYGALRNALRTMTPGEVREVVSAANLRGRGGAGFPAGKKWSFVPTGKKAVHRRSSSPTPTRWSRGHSRTGC